MSKRNTVRINMDLLDGYLTVKNITPKEFCETRLGFTDGWYYGIRKNGGRGVKVLVAQLIARSIGVEYETLVIPEEDTGKGNGNPSVTKGDSSLYTMEPLTAEREEERGTGNPSPTAGMGDLEEKNTALKMENILLKKDLEEKEKALAVAFEQIETMGREAEDGIIPVHIDDFIYVLETAITNPTMSRETNYDMLCGYINCFSGLRYLGNKRKEKAKNARPE